MTIDSAVVERLAAKNPDVAYVCRELNITADEWSAALERDPEIQPSFCAGYRAYVAGVMERISKGAKRFPIDKLTAGDRRRAHALRQQVAMDSYGEPKSSTKSRGIGKARIAVQGVTLP